MFYVIAILFCYFLFTETMVDEQTQQNFIICLASLRLLAKILGLLVSLPYRPESNMTKEIMATQIEIRSKVCNIKIMDIKIGFHWFNNILISFHFYSDFTVVKLTRVSAECHSRKQTLSDSTLDSQISSYDGYNLAAVTMLHANFRIIILYLSCHQSDRSFRFRLSHLTTSGCVTQIMSVLAI